MEGYTVFVDWKNKYCLNDYTTPRQSTDSMQYLSNYKWHFLSGTRTKFFLIWYGDTKDSE